MTFRTFFQKLTSRYLWGNLLAMGIVLAAIGTGFYFFLDFYTYHGQTMYAAKAAKWRSASCVLPGSKWR